MEPTETTVRAVRDVGPDTVAIDLDTPADFEGTPGQFVKLSTIIDGEQEARRLAERLEIHQMPNHGGWLNRVEVEQSVLVRQALRRRIPAASGMRRRVAT